MQVVVGTWEKSSWSGLQRKWTLIEGDAMQYTVTYRCGYCAEEFGTHLANDDIVVPRCSNLSCEALSIMSGNRV